MTRFLAGGTLNFCTAYLLRRRKFNPSRCSGCEEPPTDKNALRSRESSLASTKQMNEFLHRLKENDRVLLVGDTRQHEAVEAADRISNSKKQGSRLCA